MAGPAGWRPFHPAQRPRSGAALLPVRGAMAECLYLAAPGQRAGGIPCQDHEVEIHRAGRSGDRMLRRTLTEKSRGLTRCLRAGAAHAADTFIRFLFARSGLDGGGPPALYVRAANL